MKIYNKKGLIRGLFSMIICIAAVISIFMRGFSVALFILTAILFLFSITEIKRSLSRSASLEDKIKSIDERDRYIIMKTSHKSLQIINAVNYIVLIVLMVIYSVTRNSIFLALIIFSGGCIFFNFIIMLAANLYYEKHE